MQIGTLAIAKATALEWWQGGSPRLGAALAYYTIFSIAPLLVVAIAIAGLFFGEEAARGRIVETLGGMLGPQGAAAIETMVEKASVRDDRSLGASLLAFGTILLGASGAFAQLQTALDEIWDVEPKAEPGAWRFVRRRLLSFGMVLVIGFLLLVSLVVAAGVSALDELAPRSEAWQPLLAVLHFAVSIGLSTALFAAIFKVLPDRDIRWRDVWIGAFVTALLFEVGKWAIGLYLGNASIGSTYGAAGSLVIVLVWVYYSAQILFLGAEFTQVWSRRRSAPAPRAGG